MSPACSRSGAMATGQVEGHQAPPIVNNGVMFVATPGNQVLAIEAKTGNLLWRYKRPLPGGHDASCIRPAAASGSMATRSTSRRPTACWSRSTPRPARRSGPPRSMTTRTATTCRWRRSSPTARCMVGASGGELGVRGFVAAYDAETGKELGDLHRPGPGRARAARPGRQAAITTSTAAARSG